MSDTISSPSHYPDLQMRTRQHYYEIDAARSIVMFITAFIHSAGVYAIFDSGRTSNTERYFIFDWLALGLNVFAASPVFMVVGGFFAAFLLLRQGWGDFVWKRTLRLGAPLVSAACTVGLVETYLRHRVRAGSDAPGFIDYLGSKAFSADLAAGVWLHQTWFLVVLLVCTWTFAFAALVFRRIDFAPLIGFIGRAGRAVGHLPWPWLWLAVAGALVQWAVATGAAQVLPAPYQPLQLGPIGFVMPAKIILFSAFFVFGILLLISSDLFECATRGSPALFIAGALAVAAGAFLEPGQIEAGPVVRNLAYIAYLVLRWTAIMAFLALMRRFFAERPSKRFRALTDAAMTVYLVHHVLVFVLGEAFTHVDWPVALEFALVFCGSAVFSVLAHLLFVTPFGFLRLLFNGQHKQPKQPLTLSALLWWRPL